MRRLSLMFYPVWNEFSGFLSVVEDFVVAVESISTHSGAAALELTVLSQHPVQTELTY